MRSIIPIIFSLILLAGFASAETTTSNIFTEFTVAGCEVVNPYGAQLEISAGTCSVDGSYYCGTDGTTYNTRTDSRGCSFGKSTYTSGEPRCCPTGFICDKGTLTCNQGGVECANYHDSQSACENAGCYYITEDGGQSSCVSSPTEYSCSIYQTEGSCNQDTYNLGSEGVGTEICTSSDRYLSLTSGNYVVPTSSCKCVWTTNECKLEWDLTEEIYETTPDSYTCQKSFDVGSCVAGTQKISWTSTVTSGTGAFNPISAIPSEALSKPGCTDGNMERSCGEPIVRLPGFGTFSLISVIAILFLFYLFRRN